MRHTVITAKAIPAAVRRTPSTNLEQLYRAYVRRNIIAEVTFYYVNSRMQKMSPTNHYNLCHHKSEFMDVVV
jgi:hypothetical protein